MNVIQIGQQADILIGVLAWKNMLGSCLSSDFTGLPVLIDEARELLARVATDLDQISYDDAFISLAKRQIVKLDECALDPLIQFTLIVKDFISAHLSTAQELL